MWRYLKWGFRIFVVLIAGLFLYYELPRHDIVRITNTYNRLTTIGSNAIFYSSGDSGSAESRTSRDIRFIEAVRPNGHVVVYRNEDTGWVWPPYFKYNSSNVQAEATNLKSDEANPKWVRVTRYGWRIPFISIYPNAVSLKAVEGPDVTIIPWVNIVILSLLAFAAFMIRRMWLQFRERTLDPAFGQAELAGKRARGWLSSWRRPPGG
ncbi:MAG: DUF1523 family protein [Paracoccaceae bacterium]